MSEEHVVRPLAWVPQAEVVVLVPVGECRVGSRVQDERRIGHRDLGSATVAVPEPQGVGLAGRGRLRWQVSLAALLMRAGTLQVMSESTYLTAIKAASARGWRRIEPVPLGSAGGAAPAAHICQCCSKRGRSRPSAGPYRLSDHNCIRGLIGSPRTRSQWSHLFGRIDPTVLGSVLCATAPVSPRATM
jgi:hypothetical protein